MKSRKCLPSGESWSITGRMCCFYVKFKTFHLGRLVLFQVAVVMIVGLKFGGAVKLQGHKEG